MANTPTTTIVLNDSPDVEPIGTSDGPKGETNDSKDTKSAGAASSPSGVSTNGAESTEKKETTPEAKKDEEKKPDADALILKLERDGRELATKRKGLEAKEAEVKAKEKELSETLAKHRKFDAVLALGDSDPLAFVVQMCDAVGLNVDIAMDALVARKAGGERKLTAEEQIALMRREQQEREEREAQERTERERQDAEKQAKDALDGHLNDLRQCAKVAEANMPFVNDNLESAIVDAFDLMVATHNEAKKNPKVKPLSHMAALHAIEKALAEDFDRKAEKRGLKQKTESTQTPTQAAPASNGAQPRPVTNASVAPPAQTNGIRSDEEILRDFARS